MGAALRAAMLMGVLTGGRAAAAGLCQDPPVLPEPGETWEGQRVTALAIDVVGAERTHEAAVLRLMDTRVGQPFTETLLERDLNRLRATQMIGESCAEIIPEPDGRPGLRITVRVRDRWSTFFYAGTRRGGARTITRLGVFDHNFLGRLHKVWGEINSGADIPFVPRSSADRIGTSVHAVLPRLRGSRLTPFGQWTREFFDFSALSPGGSPGFIYDRHRRLWIFGLRYDFVAPATLALSLTTFEDQYRANSGSRAAGLPPREGRTSTAGWELQLGEVEERYSTFRGWQIVAAADAGRRGWLGSDFTVVSGSFRARQFWLPTPTQNTAAQVVLTGTTGVDDAHLARAGGLYEIRGFLDSTFLAQRIARVNVEHRYHLWEPRRPIHTIVQAVGFLDAGLVNGRGQAVAGLDYEGPVASVGTGLRISLIPLARAVGRVDVAFALHPLRRVDLALGVQQFF